MKQLIILSLSFITQYITEQKKLLLLISFINCNFVIAQQTAYTIPPEWKKQAAIFVSYLTDNGEAEITKQSTAAIDKLIKELAKELKVYVLLPQYIKADSLKKIFGNRRYDTSNIQFVSIDKLGATGLCRDYGPIIAQTPDGEGKIIQFEWGTAGENFTNANQQYVALKNKLRTYLF